MPFFIAIDGGLKHCVYELSIWLFLTTTHSGENELQIARLLIVARSIIRNVHSRVGWSKFNFGLHNLRKNLGLAKRIHFCGIDFVKTETLKLKWTRDVERLSKYNVTLSNRMG
jgi:hypothetical protein